MACCSGTVNNKKEMELAKCEEGKASSCCPNPTSDLKSSAVLKDEVKEYYGKTLQQSSDLKTDACCTKNAPPAYIRKAITNVHDEVVSKYYGCGMIVPKCLKGMKVLDLGCGAGRDVYIISQLVGETGFVMGVDMTEEQLQVARKYIQFHTEKFGFKAPNVEFKQGYIERLAELNLADNFFDVVVSNCVLNLSPDKEAVLKEVARILKPGGEMYFSDVYAKERIPARLQKDSVLWGECLSGALYWNDFLNISKSVGFRDPRLVESDTIAVQNDELIKLIKQESPSLLFCSATYRLFKLDQANLASGSQLPVDNGNDLKGLEYTQEDYNLTVSYRGTVNDDGLGSQKGDAKMFVLDKYNKFPVNVDIAVSGNTFLMLSHSRFAEHFNFKADKFSHKGAFSNDFPQNPFDGLNFSDCDKSSGCC
eukprot:Nk52_evm93s164 gene=Nk52_evmTU93s164